MRIFDGPTSGQKQAGHENVMPTQGGEATLGFTSSRLWLYIACAAPSFGVVLKFGKAPGLLTYLIVLAVWCGFVLPRAVKFASVLPGRAAITGIFVALMLVFSVSFLILYPLSHSGKLGGGSDRADALNVSIPRLLHHQNPYLAHTYLGAPITPLPGAMILGAPFREILRDAAYQDLFWIVAFFLFLRRLMSVPGEALLLWITAIFFNPALLQDVMTGGDFAVNGIYCALSTCALLQALRLTAGTPGTSSGLNWKLVLLAAGWGLCLCSRLNYLVVVPFVAAYALQTLGFRRGILLVFIPLAVYAALVLPIYLPAPQDFSPLHVSYKLTGLEHPTLAFWGEAAGFCFLALMAGWFGMRRGMMFALTASAVCLALPVPVVLFSTYHRSGHFYLPDFSFGLSAAVFCFVSLALLSAERAFLLLEEGGGSVARRS